MRVFALFVWLCALAFAKPLSFNELVQKPSGINKDYYIYRFLKESNPTPEQAAILRAQIYRLSPAIKKLIDSLDPQPANEPECVGELESMDTPCLAKSLDVASALKLSPALRKKLASRLKQGGYAQKAAMLKALNEKNPALALAKLGDSASFLALLNLSEQTKSLFERKFDTEFCYALLGQNGFRQTFSSLVMKDESPKFRQNFLSLQGDDIIDETAFWLGLNAISLKKERYAVKYFKQAANKFQNIFKRDNALFWLYLISGDESILKTLASSQSLNIYSLLAKEKLGDAPFKIIVPHPLLVRAPAGFNPLDPFAWQSLKQSTKQMSASELESLASKFYTQESVGAYVYFMQRAKGWGAHYFAMPPSPALNELKDSKKALIYSIARQESLFIPSSISTSYALGTMQFMPFLARDIAKQKGLKEFDQDEMFYQDRAFEFASFHLDYLNKHLSHPLFIAYAYNGGIGFTRKMLAKEHMFKGGRFEPFLSMELVPYAESRLYGKRVLANLYVYSALLGAKVKIWELLQSAKQP